MNTARLRLALADMESVAFLVDTAWSLPDDDENPRKLIPGQRLRVEMLRPGYLRIEEIRDSEWEKTVKRYGALPYNVFVSDGTRQYELARESRCVECSDANADVQFVRSKYGLTDLIDPEILFARNEVSGVEMVEQANTDDNSEIQFIRAYVRSHYSGHVLTAVDRETLLPTRVSLLPPASVVLWQTRFFDWDINPALSPSHFDSTPPTWARAKPTWPPKWGWGRQ